MKLLLSLLALAATSLSFPLSAPTSNTATCSIEYTAYYGIWTVNIGRPYLSGEGCDFVKKAIKSDVDIITKFKCKDDGTGNTQLTIGTDVKTSAEEINGGLMEAYPMIDFVGGNICWPYDP